MKTLLKLLTQSWFLALLGITLLSLAIWFGGPYVSFGSVQPFASVVSRLVAVLILVVLWALWIQLRQFRSQRAGAQLAKDMSDQAQGPGSADAAQLRARFDEAIAALRSAQGKTVNLYELPWYIIIGPPGSGKTTAIANSGLNFPLSKQFGKEALRGVGGTRNCDWWFTDEAVLLDTAGRYTTQDSDAASDQAGWLEFLTLLCKHRGRRPINGVIVAMSAADLMALSDGERRRHVEAMRRRLEELTRELKISLPVYFMVTKLDLVSGFTEFFDDLNQEGRAQVWGATFPLEVSRSGAAAARAGAEFEQLLVRLNARMMLRLEAERDVRRRALIFTFPRQFAALRRSLSELVTEAFSPAGAGQQIELRGIYFTSATQEGTPVDRMLGALARTFGLSVRGAVAQPSQGKAYFLQRLLKDVLFKETGLAGVNRRMELRQAAVNLAVYASVVVLLVVGVIAFSVSYQRNRAYLDSVATAAKPLETLPATTREGSLVQGLDRLDVLQEVVTVATQHSQDTPLSMRWGLYQGRSMSNAARDAYQRDLNAGLLPAVTRHFAGRLTSLAAEPDKLYEYLKAYLMLGMPQHLDTKQLDYIAEIEWQRIFANDPATFERIKRHFAALINDASRVQPAELDTALVDRARGSLKQASLPVLMYSRLKLSYADDAENAIVLTSQGLGTETFVSRSGRDLGKPIPALYTQEVFKEVSGIGSVTLVGRFVAERWVLGDDIAALAKSPQLTTKLMELYEADYIRVWDAVLADVALRPTSGSDDAARSWDLLSAPTSPLKQLLTLVANNTRLVDPTAKPDLTDKAAQALGSAAQVLGQKSGGPPPPGTKVTQHFASVHKLVEGSPAPIDVTLQKFAALKGVMADIATGQVTPLEAAPRLALARKDLETHTKTLPGAVQGLVSPAAGRSGSGGATVPQIVRNDFDARYQQQVVAECQELAAGRYPLAPKSSVDLPLADFARVFGPNGTYDAFLRGTLQSFVDVNRSTWGWKAQAGALGAASVPAQFQRANRIALTYFPAGASSPKVQFTVTPEFLDADVQRMVLEIDGQLLEYRHGPQRALRMEWPGPSPGQAAITLQERGGVSPNLVEQGSWALFRLLGKAQLQAQGETKFLVTFELGGRTVRLLLQASSARNPFARDVLLGFNCRG